MSSGSTGPGGQRRNRCRRELFKQLARIVEHSGRALGFELVAGDAAAAYTNAAHACSGRGADVPDRVSHEDRAICGDTGTLQRHLHNVGLRFSGIDIG